MNNINPYQQYPVESINDLCGFQEDKNRMEGFLDSAVNGQPINFMVVGERTTGKSSWLNIVDEQAKKKGLITAKFNADREHGENYLNFYADLVIHYYY